MNDPTIKYLSCGQSHTIIYKNNGDLIGFGNNAYGQLGIDIISSVNSPTLILNDKEITKIACGFNHTFFQKENGDIFGFGFL